MLQLSGMGRPPFLEGSSIWTRKGLPTLSPFHGPRCEACQPGKAVRHFLHFMSPDSSTVWLWACEGTVSPKSEAYPPCWHVPSAGFSLPEPITFSETRELKSSSKIAISLLAFQAVLKCLIFNPKKQKKNKRDLRTYSYRFSLLLTSFYTTKKTVHIFLERQLNS